MTSQGFVYLVKQSQSFPQEAFHVATKPTLNLDRKTTGATTGYNVITCSQQQLALQFATTLYHEEKIEETCPNL